MSGNISGKCDYRGLAGVSTEINDTPTKSKGIIKRQDILMVKTIHKNLLEKVEKMYETRTLKEISDIRITLQSMVDKIENLESEINY